MGLDEVLPKDQVFVNYGGVNFIILLTPVGALWNLPAESTTLLATARSTTTRFWKTSLVGIEGARSDDSIAGKNTKFGAEI